MNINAAQSAWRVLKKRYQLTDKQLELFKQYVHLLAQANKISNLTAITSERDIVELHFDDSLALTRFMDLTHARGIADVGAGGGFPGIPLKILMPHVPLFLIEVSQKKRQFLEMFIEQLQLADVHIIALDWRTFLRKTAYDIDLFCARASLEVGELVRMFKPSSPYRNAQLIYWASQSWEPEKYVRPHVTREWPYHVAGRQRRLVVLAASESSRVGA